MWLLRGSGMKGLGGMPPIHQLDGNGIESAGGLAVIRPLLDVSRAEIEGYLNEKHLTFRLDRSNQDPSFLRNWIRLKLIPQLKERMDRHLPGRLAQQAELIREEEKFLDDLAHAELDRIRPRKELIAGRCSSAAKPCSDDSCAYGSKGSGVTCAVWIFSISRRFWT